ncbi:MAG: porin [Verrucomicrobia bacterium]|nr:porin [Verrucomicrobiota bacterium]
MKNLLKMTVAVVIGAQLGLSGALAQNQELDVKALLKRIEELEQKVKVQDRKRELGDEAAAEKARTASTVSIGPGGLQVQSADSNFVMRVRGGLQADGRFFASDSVANDTFLMRRVRPILEGTVFGKFDYRLMADFASGVTQTTANNGSILDAYINARLLPGFQIQAGKFKEPVGLERLQSWRNLLFVERGFPTQLVPNRDTGVMLHGGFWNNALYYQAGVFNGTADGGSSDFDANDGDKDFAGRLFVQPFKQTGVEALRGLGFGVAGTIGDHAGTPRTYVSDGAQRFFTYLTGTGVQPNVVGNGNTWRVTPQGYYYWGPFGVSGEYVISSQELRQAGGGAGAGSRAKFENIAWQVAGSYFLTGENNSFEPVSPRKSFNLANGDWGAWEITGRVGALDVDNAAFPIFANPAQSATRASSWGVGVNWHLNRNVKLQFNYVNTDFEGGDANPAISQPEHLFLTRAQFAF